VSGQRAGGRRAAWGRRRHLRRNVHRSGKTVKIRRRGRRRVSKENGQKGFSFNPGKGYRQHKNEKKGLPLTAASTRKKGLPRERTGQQPLKMTVKTCNACESHKTSLLREKSLRNTILAREEIALLGSTRLEATLRGKGGVLLFLRGLGEVSSQMKKKSTGKEPIGRRRIQSLGGMAEGRILPS